MDFGKQVRIYSIYWKLFVISSNNQIMYKLLFILFIIKMYARINILLNDLESKHSFLIKFGQFRSYYKIKQYIKKVQ